MEQRVRRNMPSPPEMRPVNNGRQKFDDFATTAMTHHQVVFQTPCGFWKVYDNGRISTIHQRGFLNSSSVMGCTASLASCELASSSVEAAPPCGGDRGLPCTIEVGMCHRGNASRSKWIGTSERTICSTIQRSGMLARVFGALFNALPPPTSASRQPTAPGSPSVRKRTGMTAGKPHLRHIFFLVYFICLRRTGTMRPVGHGASLLR